MAAVALAMLHELDLAPKLLTITGDNADSDGTIFSPAAAVRLWKELFQYSRTHREIENLLPSEEDWLLQGQIERVLKPFWDYANVVSSDMPAIGDSLAIYWSLADLRTDVSTAQGDFQNIHTSVQEAARHALEKAEKFIREMDENILYYVSTVLGPRIKTSLITAQMNTVDAALTVSQVRDFLPNIHFGSVFPRSLDNRLVCRIQCGKL
ncbi:hypothetical protein RBB50_012873 [Rhinocladiella similis]